MPPGVSMSATAKAGCARGANWRNAWRSRHRHRWRGGHRVSARESFLRATTYHRLAEYGALPTDPRFDGYWRKSVACFQQAGALFNPPIQTLEVPFEGRPLAAYYWRPDTSRDTRPTIIAVGGNDSSLEELVMGIGTGAVARGYNFFAFDHPGHRGAVHRYRDCIKRPDYEQPYKVAIDLLTTLPGVDERIALSGFSFGGYICSRVACFEKRIKALIPDSPIIDNYRIAASFWMTLVGKIPDRYYFKMMDYVLRNKPILKAYKAYTDTSNGTLAMSLKERIELAKTLFFLPTEMLAQIECPTLVLVSEDEGEEFVRQSRTFFDSIASTEKRLHIFSLAEDGSNDHCQLDNFSRANQVIFDWLDEVFTYRGIIP
jgi:cephalosporin-C deacetylase-like acetyl esterase